ncbi:MAG: hypothetical protein V4547_18830 [Bacteroidota bacterium]
MEPEKGIFENSEIKVQTNKSVEVKSRPVSFVRVFTVVLYSYISILILSGIAYGAYRAITYEKYDKAYYEDEQRKSDIHFEELKLKASQDMLRELEQSHP